MSVAAVASATLAVRREEEEDAAARELQFIDLLFFAALTATVCFIVLCGREVDRPSPPAVCIDKHHCHTPEAEDIA